LGRFRILHEHLASQAIHAHLCRMQRYPVEDSDNKPRLLVATPAGQHCGLGALAISVLAHDHGWEAVYLGPDLPSEEIAAARTRLDARLIALSITCRINDATLMDELRNLSDFVDGRCPIIVGGQASQRYRAAIEASGAKLCTATEDFVALLK
jgi:methanogenic corrinoid protein MtbC1